MEPKKQNKLTVAIRAAIKRDGRSLYRIGKDAGVSYQTLHPYVRRQRNEITIETAARLCEVLGLELRPARKAKRGNRKL